MYDYLGFLAQKERYEDDVRQAAIDRLASQARPADARETFGTFNSLAILGAILLSVLIMAMSVNP